VQIVCKSYFDAAEAADDLETLIAVGHPPGDITLVMSHRPRLRSRRAHPQGLRTPSAIADVVLKLPRCPTALSQSLKQQGIKAYEEHGSVVIVCGALAMSFPVLDGVDRAGHGLHEALVIAGVRPRKAERLMVDLLRGGIVVAVRVNDAASEITRRILGDSEILKPPMEMRHRGISLRDRSTWRRESSR
jgi:hypothetical protein